MKKSEQEEIIKQKRKALRNEIFLGILFMSVCVCLVVGTGLIKRNELKENNIPLEENDMFPEEKFEETYNAYVIEDNKLYYNINCNGNLKPHFITDVDEENDNFSIAGTTFGEAGIFPVVMVNGEPKVFMLMGLVKTADNYFYTVKEILIKEVSINELNFVLTGAELVWQSGDDLKQQNQYIQTEMQCFNTVAIVVKEKNDLNLKPKNGYEIRVYEEICQKRRSWKEIHQIAKECIFGK